ncbi:MAG: MFS transporter [Fibrobacter sp.]|jgi:EmrB/QacA subfamily drug resistance transporter|nr:MFS transporter [Fibrobacter sp.]
MAELKNKRAVLFATTIGAFLIPYGASSINIALPALGNDLKMNAVLLSWVGTLYLLSAAIFLVPFGRLADIYGRKKVFFWGIIIFTVASVLKAFSASIAFLFTMQLINGIGAAMVFATAVAIVTTIYPPSQRGQILGINVASTYLGLSVGPVIGGFLTQFWGWRAVFLSNVPLGILIIILVLFKVKTDWAEARGESFDIAGSLIYGLGLAIMMYGISRLPSIIGALISIIGVGVVAFFLIYETHITSPVLHIGLFKGNTVFTFSNIAALINYSATHAVVFLLSLYLQYVRGFKPQKAGLILFVQPMIMAIFSPIAGRLSDRFEPRIVASSGMALNVIGLIMLAFIGPDTAVSSLIITLLILGTGFALFSSPNTSAAMGSVQKRYYGIASATIGTMRLLGQMFSMAISTLIFTVRIGEIQLNSDQFQPFLIGLRGAFYVFAGVCAFGVLASYARGKVLQSD